MKVVSTCKMDVHKFPFDTQRCNITIGSAMHCGEGGSVCDMWLHRSLCYVFFYLHLLQVGFFSSHLSWWIPAHSFLQLLSGHAVFPRGDEDAGRVGVPPAIRHQLQFHLPWENVGAAHIHCKQIQRDLKCISGQTWVQMRSYRAPGDHWMVWCVMLLPLQSSDLNQPVNDPRKGAFRQHSLQNIKWGNMLMFKPPVESR